MQGACTFTALLSCTRVSSLAIRRPSSFPARLDGCCLSWAAQFLASPLLVGFPGVGCSWSLHWNELLMWLLVKCVAGFQTRAKGIRYAHTGL